MIETFCDFCGEQVQSGGGILTCAPTTAGFPADICQTCLTNIGTWYKGGENIAAKPA